MMMPRHTYSKSIFGIQNIWKDYTVDYCYYFLSFRPPATTTEKLFKNMWPSYLRLKYYWPGWSIECYVLLSRQVLHKMHSQNVHKINVEEPVVTFLCSIIHFRPIMKKMNQIFGICDSHVKVCPVYTVYFACQEMLLCMMGR